MRRLNIASFSGAALLILCGAANAEDAIEINNSRDSALLDGRCGDDEWDAATKIELPGPITLYLMHDESSFFLCGKGVDGQPTALDLYIQNPQTEHLHHFHLSAQMGEQVFANGQWSETATWDLKDYAGFWTPYFGLQETDSGQRPKFYRGSHKQVQILRRKFPGDTWNMMINLAVGRDGQWVSNPYPADAVETDPSTWNTYTFP